MASVALVINPVYTYNRGRLVLDEKQLMERIMNAGNHSTDWAFHILFKEKSDARDLRPMIYSGKFIFASPLELAKKLDSESAT